MQDKNNSNSNSISVLEINLEGIEFLKKGQYADATASFSRGLKFLLSGVRNTPAQAPPVQMSTPNTECTRNQESPSQAKDQSYRVLSSISSDEQCDEQGTISSRLAAFDDAFVLFNRALQVTADPSHTHTSDQALWSGVLLFNAGLANHLWGLKTENSQLLVRALKLYSAAETCFPSSGGQNLGMFALWNNYGHIKAHFLHLGEAEEHCHNLSQSLLNVDRGVLSNEEYYIFFFNACFYRKRSLPSAPAA